MCAFCDKSRELDATGPANGRLSIPDLRTLRTLRGLRLILSTSRERVRDTYTLASINEHIAESGLCQTDKYDAQVCQTNLIQAVHYVNLIIFFVIKITQTSRSRRTLLSNFLIFKRLTAENVIEIGEIDEYNRQKGQDAEVWRSSDEESEESEKADMVMREDRTENEDKRCCPDDLGRCGAAGTWELQPDQSTHPGPLSA
ncbi:PREDICTED: uncharacterized protein LOC105153870 [Acromyrmex echinatior]|uniref:uncharacterized protein LOC105153870 n=1 Tax=Acromyrmex echinatior TaxID=103372 RepID=UPI000580FD82|nr:PREDICTED: uncharacterized protein LOC105153870 [Acromyrmex echinatior]